MSSEVWMCALSWRNYRKLFRHKSLRLYQMRLANTTKKKVHKIKKFTFFQHTSNTDDIFHYVLFIKL